MDGPSNASQMSYRPRHQDITDISPKKSMVVVVIVVGCFAVLWPKVFYPMLVGNATQAIKPNALDKATGCCDVFSETDVNTIELMSEVCSSIIDQSTDRPLSGKEIVSRCRKEILQTCSIDISAVLQEQIRFGKTTKQILNEVRSLNGSLCLKYHFGVSPWRLGVGHRIHINYAANIKQERPPNIRPDLVHPAFRERGSAISKPSGAQFPRKHIRTVEARPGPIPGMRPTMGGPGHVVPPSQKAGNTMGVLMPIYTIGIVIFFTYTLMKLIFKRENTGVRGNLYPPIDPDPRFRREVFESESCRFKPRLSRDPTGRIVVNAMSALLDQVNEEIEARRRANQAKADRNLANGNLSNGAVHKDQEQASVKVLGMETTASCEGGEKWTKPGEPVVAHVVPKIEVAPPQEIYLEGALPAQSQILVADSATVTQAATIDTMSDPAVILAGKMTLSVISMDNAEEDDPETKNDRIGDSLDVNGEETVDDVEESKYTTASSATIAEHEISDDQGTDDEDASEEVEKIGDLDLDVNHISSANENDVFDRNGEDRENVPEERTEETVENSFVVVREGNDPHRGSNKEKQEGKQEEEEILETEEEVEVEEEEVEEQFEVEEEEEGEEVDVEEDLEENVKEDTEIVKEELEELEVETPRNLTQSDVNDTDTSDKTSSATKEIQSSQ